MFRQLSLGAVLALTVGALGAGTAWAHDPYDPYPSYSDQRSPGHAVRDATGGVGHALHDIFKYGSTDPYSSPRHYNEDQQRRYNHALRDEDRAYGHRSYRSRSYGAQGYYDSGYGHGGYYDSGYSRGGDYGGDRYFSQGYDESCDRR